MFAYKTIKWQYGSRREGVNFKAMAFFDKLQKTIVNKIIFIYN